MSATTDREKLMAALACISKLEALVQALGGEETLEGREGHFAKSVRDALEANLKLLAEERGLELRRCYAIAADALCWAREFGPVVDGYNPPEKVEAGEAFRAVRGLVTAARVGLTVMKP